MDPIAVYNPIFETEHYIEGQHNGGVFNAGNLNSYGYCYQSPVKFVDPNGKQVEFKYTMYESAKAAIAKTPKNASFSEYKKIYRQEINARLPFKGLEKMDKHLFLDAVGLIPVIGEGADLANGIWYAFEGDYLNAGLSIGAAVPFVGWASTGTKLGIRAFKLSDNAMHSASGLIYKLGSKHGNRWSHVLAHKVNDLSKDLHGVWNKNMSDGDIAQTIDNAWEYIKKNNIKGTIQSNGNRVFTVKMAGQVGTQGGRLGNGGALNNVRIVVKDGTSEVISAFPK